MTYGSAGFEAGADAGSRIARVATARPTGRRRSRAGARAFAIGAVVIGAGGFENV